MYSKYMHALLSITDDSVREKGRPPVGLLLARERTKASEDGACASPSKYATERVGRQGHG